MDLTLLITVFHIRSTSTATLHIEEDQDLVLRPVRREALTAVLLPASSSTSLHLNHLRFSSGF